MITPSIKYALSPAAAHFESIAAGRNPDYIADTLTKIPQSVPRLLDAGCASGRLTLHLASRAEFAVGMDLSRDLIDLARRFQKERRIANVAWVVGNIEHPPFRAECFDLVTSTNVLRLTNLPVSIEALGRLVKPGGRMMIQDVFILARWLPWLPRLHLLRTFRSVPRYLSLFGPKMMLRIVAYRFSPNELLRSIRIQSWTLGAIEETYHRILHGSSVQKNQWGYIADWIKPSFHS